MKNRAFEDPGHGRQVDLMALDLAKQIGNVKMYCLSEESPLMQYLPLAEIQNQQPMRPEDKPSDAIKDFLSLPPVYTGGKVTRIFQALGLAHEYKDLKSTFVVKILRDVWVIFQSIAKISVKLLSRLLPGPKKRKKKYEK